MAKTIREFRDERGMTLQQFAQFLDVSISALSLWELGKSSPRTRMRQRIAEKLKVKVDEIEWPVSSRGKMVA